ncbi:hypothetical protein EAI_10246, partial [Harpegnathos saltator]
LKLHLFLAGILDSELWHTLDRVTHEQAVCSAEKKTRKQKEKYNKINHRYNKEPKQTNPPSEITILAKEHNFAVIPASIPTEEIISQVETTIYHLTPKANNDVRNRIANILRKAK